MADRSGEHFGNYRLVRLLGQGGFAEVYLGQHLRLNLQSAIKVLHAHLTGQEAEHFQQEAQTIAKLMYPAIVRILDYDVQEGVPFLVMDYAPGGSLRQRYPKSSIVPLPEVLSSVKQVAAALHYAHERKFIHRDVKPENMLVGCHEEILLSDFGLADMLEKIATRLDEVQKAKVTSVSAPPSPTATHTSSGVTQISEITSDTQAAAAQLQQKVQNETYDDYICYDEADEAEVFKIGEQLKTNGILPWFDNMDVKPGTPTRQQQEQQIEKIPSAAIFVGKHAVAKWQALQMYSFLEQFVERGRPVIPVLLADTPQKPKLPVFLANFDLVDFRRQVPEPMGRLIWGITGKRPSS